MKSAHTLINDEREKQLLKGHDNFHDDEHIDGELIYASIYYATCALGKKHHNVSVWPWDDTPAPIIRKNSIPHLVKAAALLIAEIERLQRLK